MALLNGWLRRFTQTDEERLTEEVREWAEAVPDTRRIGACGKREKVRIAGVVRRLTLHPVEGTDSMSAVVYDGTGEVTALWTGRDEIPGLRLGTRLVLEGLLATERDALRMVNPRFEFA